ncbi:MAG: metallophosphoesterase [Verrucomicrobiota bacterium]
MSDQPTRRGMLGWGAATVGAGILAEGRGEEKALEKPFRIAYFTDVHAREEDSVRRALRKAAEAILAADPDAILGGGDYVHGGIRGSLAQGKQRLEVVENDFLGPLREGLGNRPMRLMLGNHDLIGAQPEDGSSAVEKPKDLFLQAQGLEVAYQSAEWAGYQMVILDSVEFTGEGEWPYRGIIDDVQMTWLRELAETLPEGKPMILTTHIPFRTTFFQVSQGPYVPLAPSLAVENGNKVIECFAKQDVRMILQGHLHFDEHLRVNDFAIRMGGAVCGSWWKGSNLETPPGFLVLDLYPDRIESEYVPFGWEAAILT